MMAVIAAVTLHAHTYTNRSILADGHFVKVSVKQTGLCYLTYEDIRNAGINPQQVRIFGYGGAKLSQDFTLTKIDDLPAVPFYTYTGSDGVFNAGDYIVFYAQGPVQWGYNGSRFTHTKNCYSNYGYYFLSDDAGEQQPIVTRGAAGNPSHTVTQYSALGLHEVDSINVLGLEEGGGQEFYEILTKKTISFETPNINATKPVRIYLDAAAYSPMNSYVQLSMNGQQRNSSTIWNIPSNDFYTKANPATAQYDFPAADAAKQQLVVEYKASSTGSTGYLNYVEMTATCTLQYDAKPLYVRNVEHYGNSSFSTYSVANGSNQLQVWNVSDLSDIHGVSATLSGTNLQFVGSDKNLQTFVVFDPALRQHMQHAAVVGEVANQNLHELIDVDMIILCPEMFLAPAHRLADAHGEQGLIVEVVTDEQVYNEFSSGTPDATAYRWLMKMLYDRYRDHTATTAAPQYLLLMGDGTFDNRKLLPNSGNNVLLTYQAQNSLIETNAYTADDYFAMLDDNAAKNDASVKNSNISRMDIAVGRLPVNNLTEANNVVDKTIRYLQDHQAAPWHQQLLFLADDGDSNQHTEYTDKAAKLVAAKSPEMVVNKVYLDAYPQEIGATGETYPIAQNRFDNLIRQGVLFMDFTGHGSPNGVTTESIITAKKLREMTNPHTALWYLATCRFSHWDAGTPSAGELAVLNPHGGALATISACRTVYASPNDELNRLFCDTLFAHHGGDYNMTIGHALRAAKNKRGNDLNKMPYSLLGDPAVRLHYPDNLQIVTTSALDTLHALSIQQIEGEVQEGGQLAEWFNGPLYVTIWDKAQRLTTLDNDQPNEDRKVTYTYTDYPNKLFSGKANVENGRFQFTFMVPKDIRYNYGNGRIVYYASDSLTQAEATGYHHDWVIGGSSPVTILDTIGPEMRIYLDRPSFRDGDQTCETPHFYAELEDEHGINTVGSGIGHDLLLVLDNDANQNYVLNEYFTSEMNSISRGTVDYILPTLEEGPHSLTFRAWDLMNNSSSQSLSFQVVKGYDPEIYSVITYPNPVGIMDDLHIVIDYNRNDEPVDADIYIYDISGKLVYQFHETATTEMHWRLSDAHVHAGVYIYKVQLQTENSKPASRSGKIIVTE